VIKRYNTDDLRDVAKLQRKQARPSVVARGTVYGQEPGFRLVQDFPDGLVDPKDYKEVIAFATAERMFPLDHQRNTWAPPGIRWNQNGIGYCWAWSLAASVMDDEAKEGKRQPGDDLLAPVSLGWLVNWRDQGNYLSSAIRGATERGICSAKFAPRPHDYTGRSLLNGWEEDALLHRINPDDVWDTDNSTKARMIQHCVTILTRSVPAYIAYYWWGHALELVGLEWDESEVNNLVWLIRNSHDEDDVIELVGSRAVPDEAFGIRATRTAA